MLWVILNYNGKAIIASEEFFFFFFQLSGNGINNSWKILWPYSSFGLLQLAGSDINKTNIIEKQGMDRLMKLSARFSEDSSMLQEV